MISPETIALVKERTDIVALIAETVKLTRKGRSWTGLCPFHKEKSPSFNVNADRGFFHCFGCKESGSSVDFLMKLHGLSFRESVEDLAQRLGIAIEETATAEEQREANAARRTKDDLYRVNQLAALYFEQCMRPGSEGHPLAHYAREEVERRGLGAGSGPEAAHALQTFRVGYAPHAWDALASHLKRQGISPLVAEHAGLLIPRSNGPGHFDRFIHRLMFAVVDVMGRVVAFSGRALPDPSPTELQALGNAGPRPDPEKKPAKYVNSPESPIYTKGEHLFGLYQAKASIRQTGEAVLVEGNFDVVSLHARGIGNAVAPLGTAFTPPQAKLMKRFAPNVIILFDGDTAGRKATRASRGPCREGGLSARVASLPDGLDPDDFTRTRGAEALKRVLHGASGMLEHLIDDALEQQGFGGASITEQLARIRAVAQLLTEEDDPNLRTMAKHYADRLSSKLIVLGRSPGDLRQLEAIIEQATSRRPASNEPRTPLVTPAQARSRSQVTEIGLAMLGAVLDAPEILDELEVEEALGVLEGEPALAIAAARQTRDTTKGIYAVEFLAQIPATVHAFAAGRMASPVFDGPDEARAELLDNARKLKRLTLQRENAAVADEPNRAEALGDVASVEAILREVQRRSREKLGIR